MALCQVALYARPVVRHVALRHVRRHPRLWRACLAARPCRCAFRGSYTQWIGQRHKHHAFRRPPAASREVLGVSGDGGGAAGGREPHALASFQGESSKKSLELPRHSVVRIACGTSTSGCDTSECTVTLDAGECALWPCACACACGSKLCACWNACARPGPWFVSLYLCLGECMRTRTYWNVHGMDAHEHNSLRNVSVKIQCPPSQSALPKSTYSLTPSLRCPATIATWSSQTWARGLQCGLVR